MTGGAHLDEKVFAERRTRRQLVTATTGYLDIAVVGMEVGFHGLAIREHASVRKGRVIYSEVAVAASPRRYAIVIHRSCG